MSRANLALVPHIMTAAQAIHNNTAGENCSVLREQLIANGCPNGDLLTGVLYTARAVIKHGAQVERLLQDGVSESDLHHLLTEAGVNSSSIPYVIATVKGYQPAPTAPPAKANGNIPPAEAAAALRASEQPTEAIFVDPLPEVPASMKKLRQWVRWKLEPGPGGNLTKIPYQVNGMKADSTDPRTWTDYYTAVTGATIDDQQGVGLVVDGGLVGIDLDGCYDAKSGKLTPWAERIVNALDSYTEITPSGTGVRVWVCGQLPEPKKVFNLDPACGYGNKVKIEVYTDSRYFTVTGNSYFEINDDYPSVVEERDLKEAYQVFHEIRAQFLPPRNAAKDSVADADEATPIESLSNIGTSKYDIFMNGQIESREPFIISNGLGRLRYPSQSEADLAFCTVLAVYHDGDVTKIDGEYRQSPLMRPKWERKDYRENMTIAKAIESAEKLKAKSVSATSVSVPALAVAQATASESIPIIDDPSDNDPRFEMTGDTFDTKVYEDMAQRFTPYPDPGEGDLISLLSKKLVTGTNIPLAYVREPLKAIILHALDGTLAHPAFPRLSLRGNYFSLGESESGKTTGLEWALQSATPILDSSQIHAESLFRYKSETTFVRSFTSEGTIKRDKDGNVKSGRAGNSSQFLHIKEGNLVANCSDYFAAVFSQLTNLYDQTEAGTESMTNGDFTAKVVKASTVMCFTPTDFKATFGGKGTIGGGGLNRWGLTNPPEDHSYDDRDWERLDDSVFQDIIGRLCVVVYKLQTDGRVVLDEEPGAVKVRLEVKTMLKKAGKVGKRLLDYFMREQIAQAAVAVDGRLVMTTEQALYAKQWVEAQVASRLNCWPSDANNQIEAMEHAVRKAVSAHHVSEKTLKDACNFYREGSGGWFVYSAALKNMVESGVIKWTGKTRKGARTYCPGSCAIHLAFKDEKLKK